MLGAKLQAAAGATAAPSGWDLSNAVGDFGIYGAFRVFSEEISPQGIFFKSDGTKMYVIGSSGDDVNEYDLSSAWEVSTASYVQNFSVSSQEILPHDLFFKPDGTKMYVLGDAGNDVNEYDLSSAWDVSSASYVQNFSVYSQEFLPTGLFFKPDGTKMYVTGTSGDDVNEYDLSSAWDISTASYVQNFSVFSEEISPQGIFFKSDGTKMYVIGSSGDDVNEYDLSSAWDISTASYVQNFIVVNRETSSTGIFFKPDGTKMYIIGTSESTVYAYSLSSAWDISTASWDAPTKNYLSIDAQEIIPTGLSFKPDGTKMYVIGSSGDDVNEYTLNSAWDITTASYVQNFSVVAQESSSSGVFFKPDGAKMYVIGSSGDEVNEYTLSSAWDISTASYVQNFRVSSQEFLPTGLFFKPDGTKMYVTGTSGDDVNEYDLSSAWDISTASYVQNFSVSSQESLPTGVFFKPDGAKMYVIGRVGADVNEYDLSSAWDISTASYVQNFRLDGLLTGPQDVFFKPDGTKMYIVDSDINSVLVCDL